MKHYEVLAGKYAPEGENTRIYRKGEIVASNRNLVKDFGPLNFREVHPSPTAPAAAPSNEEEPIIAPPPAGNTAPKAPAAAGALGEDVTVDFELAASAELKVFKKGPNFFVTNPDDVTKALNKHPLKLKEVDGFLEKLLKKS